MQRRFTFGTIAFLAVAGQEFQSTCLPVDHPHAVALSVGQINISLWTHSNAFGSGQRRGLGRATITGKTFFPSACFVVNGAAPKIKPIDGVSFAEGKPHLVSLKINRPRPVERNALDRGSVRRELAFARAGKSGDAAGFRIHSPNAMITDVTNVQVSGRPKLNTVRPIHRGFRGWTAIAAKTAFAGTGDGAYATCLGTHLAHEMILHFHKHHISCGIESDFVRFI